MTTMQAELRQVLDKLPDHARRSLICVLSRQLAEVSYDSFVTYAGHQHRGSGVCLTSVPGKHTLLKRGEAQAIARTLRALHCFHTVQITQRALMAARSDFADVPLQQYPL